MCRLALVACLLLGLGLALASRADAYIYWGNQSNGNFGPTISRSNTDGSSADPNFMSGFGIDDPEGMVTDGKYLFFANGQGNTLGMSNLDGSNVNGDIVTECVNNALPCYPQGMAIQGNQLYWANFGSLYDIGSIGHATIDYVNGNYTGLSDVNPKFIYPLVSAHAVAIRGSDIFWSDQQSIGHANVNGDTVTNVNENWIVDDNNFQGTYIGTTAAPWGMAIDNNDLYWDDYCNDLVAKTTLNGSNPVTSHGSLIRLAGPGGDPQECNRDFEDLAADGTYLYWTSDLDGGEVSRMGKDGSNYNSAFIQGSSNIGPGALTAGITVDHSSSTTVSCSPGSLPATTTSICTATVTDTDTDPSSPTGTVSFSSNGNGAFGTGSTCTLTTLSADQSVCSVAYAPAAQGIQIVTASIGNAQYVASSGQATLTVSAPPSHPTTTTLGCLPSTIAIQAPTTCTATVTDISASPTSPTGTVYLGPQGSGTFAPSTSCSLNPGGGASSTCQFTYSPNFTGPFTLAATYAGSSTYGGSTGQAQITATTRATTTSLSCSPSPETIGFQTTCSATITDTDAGTASSPDGTVTFTAPSGTFTPTSCTLPSAIGAQATCSVKFAPGAVNTTLTASYAGSGSHTASSGQLQFTATLRPTGTSISCSPNPVTLPATTTCTASVYDDDYPGDTNPAGPVTMSTSTPSAGSFASGGTCTLTPISGSASGSSCSLVYTPNATGTPRIGASYGGDSVHASSTAYGQTLTVNGFSTSTTVACTPSTLPATTATTCLATVTDTQSGQTAAPTGTVGFTSSVNAENPSAFSPAASCTLVAGGSTSSTCSVTYVPPKQESPTITAAYGGGTTFSLSSGSEGLTVNAAPLHTTSTAVACAPSFLDVLDPTTCTATVTDTYMTNPSSPTGSVVFSSKTSGTFGSGGKCTLSGATSTTSTCSLTFSPSAVVAAQNSLTATYASSGTYAGSAGQASISVQLRPTLTALDCEPPSVMANVSTTCTASVIDNDGTTQNVPTGTVSFANGSNGAFGSGGTCTLSPVSGQTNEASCEVPYTPAQAGSPLVTASYGGSASDAASMGSENVTVSSRSTSSAIACQPSSLPATTSTTCTATVTDTAGSGTAGSPDGTVAFSDGGAGGAFGSGGTCTLAPAAANQSSCSATYTPASPGSPVVTASYGGSATYDSSSNQATLTVGSPPPPPATTSTAVTCSPSPVTVTQTTTCTLTVSNTSGSSSPDGSVQFTYSPGGLLAGTNCSLTSSGTGQSSCSVLFTPGQPGNLTITATYAGDASFGSSQGMAALEVDARTTSTVLACQPTALSVGQTTACTATVTDTDQNGTASVPDGTVGFTSDTAGDFAPNTTCTLAPAGSHSSSCSLTLAPSTAGNRMLTASYGGDGSTFAASTDKQAVDVSLRATSTALDCQPATGTAGTATTCTATVGDDAAGVQSAPGDDVTFASSGNGSFGSNASCTLVFTGPAQSACSVTFTPSDGGSQHVTATYAGDTSHGQSTGTVLIGSSTRSTTTVVSCTPGSLTAASATSCVATVTDTDAGTASAPTGSVALSSSAGGSFTPGASCPLVQASPSSSSCTSSYTPSAAGNPQVSAAYAGDAAHASSSAQTTLSVAAAPGSTKPPAGGTTGPQGPTGHTPTLPTNAFSFGKLVLNRKHRTATLFVNLPGAGKLVLSGPQVRRVTITVRRRGTVGLTIIATGTALKTLRSKGRATLSLTVSYTPTGGKALAHRRTVVLRSR